MLTYLLLLNVLPLSRGPLFYNQIHFVERVTCSHLTSVCIFSNSSGVEGNNHQVIEAKYRFVGHHKPFSVVEKASLSVDHKNIYNH